MASSTGTMSDAASTISAGLSKTANIAKRLDFVDLLRGWVMVIMALDHIRDYMTWRLRAVEFLPSHNSLVLFLTRWITHFCAPTFFFLAGTGAYLMLARRSRAEVSRFLWTRGWWLAFLECTVIWFAWGFMPMPTANLIVIMALGACMIILAALIHIPVRWLAALSLLVIATHNLLDRIDPTRLSEPARAIFTIAHAQGFLKPPPDPYFLVLYPLVPWFAVMSAGFCFGAIVRMPKEQRIHYTSWIGAVATALFVVLRGFNLYGNSTARALAAGPWKHMDTPAMTLASFLNVTKYPPSLDFLLMTLGPALLALALFDGLDWGRGWFSSKIVVFGRVPMFYYVLHLFVVHLMALAFAAAFHQPHQHLNFMGGGIFAGSPAPGFGFNLPSIYTAWALSIFLLYFPCARYARYKAEHKEKKWLSYL